MFQPGVVGALLPHGQASAPEYLRILTGTEKHVVGQIHDSLQWYPDRLGSEISTSREGKAPAYELLQ